MSKLTKHKEQSTKYQAQRTEDAEVVWRRFTSYYSRQPMTPAGLYIHIPFCKSRCSYCDFATGLYDSDLAERYILALSIDIQNTGAGRCLDVDTIYFGGGTPSMLSPNQIVRIMSAVYARFTVKSQAEITIEINPGSVDRSKLNEFQRLGINRASFGAQTFDDNELARLGRSHNSTDTLKTFRYLRDAGFANISFDLIAGLPGQTLDQWRRNVELSLELRPEHLSFYLLEIHSNTPLAQHIERGLQPKPDDDLATEMYKWMLERACDAGYEHYEISNLCLPGFESRHNKKYWNGASYYGFGCSAHSYNGSNLRWSNERDLVKYVEAVEKGQSPVVAQNKLSDADLRAEALFLGMRLLHGVNILDYRRSFGIDIRVEHSEELDRFCEAGLIEFDGDLLRLTRAGALMSNEVFAALI